MKYLFLSFVFGLFCIQVTAQKAIVKTSFEVNGNCNMCRKTIEKAAKINGVASAKWHVNNHILELVYDSTLVSLDKIQLRIAAAGYDTPAYRANDETYAKLHACCQYDRKK
ncbi:MAG: copper chaperone [Saprospiraceae bacterium]|nr:copper chaperone [Saprospiraceae bacterium]HMW38466.1 copper chaperone [Saprospiraceae bacterium]HMX87564.1 copper chaperone [Saprospiraceae bacterium]HMZ39558.1 copper chaperone [Saprospiraceae bacterium]HNA64215.1 copper chaperone [Saprospiraceae bacterium]